MGVRSPTERDQHSAGRTTKGIKSPTHRTDTRGARSQCCSGHSAFLPKMKRESREAAREMTAAGHPSAGTVLAAPPPAPQEGGSDPTILAEVTKRDHFVLPTSFLF